MNAILKAIPFRTPALSYVLEVIRTRYPFKISYRPRHAHSLTVLLLSGLEALRTSQGVFCAAASKAYTACWIRDQLYSTLPYYYLGEFGEFRKGIWIVFDIFHKHKNKIEHIICHPPKYGHEFIHAKFHPETLEEVTPEWGHHQLDAIGLFLFIVSFAEEQKISVIRDHKDKEILQLLVQYLTAVRFWEHSDNGMWEEGMDRHASSIGACVRGLSYIKDRGLAVVPMSLIYNGYKALDELLPNETGTRDVDMAQLSLIWPYGVVTKEIADTILEKVEKKLVQKNGLNRYLDDNYYRSQNGVSGEWTMGFFWLSIIYAERNDMKQAEYWFNRGLATMTPEGHLPELYYNGIPNDNTPLAWSHALAIIAERMLHIYRPLTKKESVKASLP